MINGTVVPYIQRAGGETKRPRLFLPGHHQINIDISLNRALRERLPELKKGPPSALKLSGQGRHFISSCRRPLTMKLRASSG